MLSKCKNEEKSIMYVQSLFVLVDAPNIGCMPWWLQVGIEFCDLWQKHIPYGNSLNFVHFCVFLSSFLMYLFTLESLGCVTVVFSRHLFLLMFSRWSNRNCLFRKWWRWLWCPKQRSVRLWIYISLYVW